MNKFFRSLCVTLLFIMLMPIAHAESTTDFSGFSYDELVNIREALNTEITSRPEAGKTKYSSGGYNVGTDIPAGRYKLFFFPEEDDSTYTNYYVYENKSMYDYDVGRLWLGDLPKDEGQIKANKEATVELHAGEYFVLYRSGAEVERIGNVQIADATAYEVPKGTAIPIGKFIVGDDIPEGKYNVYYNGETTSRFRVYPNSDEADNTFGDSRTEAVLNSTNTSAVVSLKTGEIVKVEYSSVIMTKGTGFVFD